MPSNPKPSRMWGWTNADGVMCLCSRLRDHWPSDLFGGTRIRVTVVPDKKPARTRKYRPVIDHTKFGTVNVVPVTKPAKKNPGPQLVASLRGLRDTLRSGKSLDAKYATTTYIRVAAKPAKKRSKKA